jgi:uncharacterized protein (DUF1810 family)
MFSLDRFITAHESIFPSALGELRGGRKRTHWMWFVFPQLAGLGSSAMALRYAIKTREKDSAYQAHPVLVARLTTCAEAVLMHTGRSAEAILGAVDAMKPCSPMTRFAEVPPTELAFEHVLAAFSEECTMLALWLDWPSCRKHMGMKRIPVPPAAAIAASSPLFLVPTANQTVLRI